MKPTLYTATGECVTPGRELGKGGDVYCVAGEITVHVSPELTMYRVY